VEMKVKQLVAVLAVAAVLLVAGLLVLGSTMASSVHPEAAVDGRGGTWLSETCWLPKGREFCAPQFVIPGSMKCGTTSMFAYLMKHPDVLELRSSVIDKEERRNVMANKEVRFFNDPAWRKLTKAHGVTAAVGKYLDLFEEIPGPNMPRHPDPEVEANRGKITGESSPMYVCQQGVADRIKDHLPFVKVILMLRNPVDRAYSEYWFRQSLRSGDAMEKLAMDEDRAQAGFRRCFFADLSLLEHCGSREWAQHPQRNGVEEVLACYKAAQKQVSSANPSVDPVCQAGSPLAPACMTSEDRGLCSSHGVQNGVYALQIMEYLEAFPAEQLMIIRSEDFYGDTVETMRQVQEFLVLEDFDWETATQKAYNIVNPRSPAGSKADLLTTDKESSKGLQMGASATSAYPPLRPSLRVELEAAMAPYNAALAKVLGRQEFLWR